MRLTLALIAAGLVLTACGGSGRDQPDPGEYKEAIAETMELGLIPYWLGPDLRVDGTEWDVIETGVGAYEEASGDWLGLNYVSTGRCAPVGVSTYALAYWETRESDIRNPRANQPIRRSTLDVAGGTADIQEVPQGTRDPNAVWLILELEEVAVTVQASACVGSDGIDQNPLTSDIENFKAVMANLRPYDGD